MLKSYNENLELDGPIPIIRMSFDEVDRIL